MSSIKDTAKSFVPKSTKNIADLQSVSVDLAVLEGKGKNKDNKEFAYNFIEVDGEEYRVPDKVLNDLKAILAKKPTLKTFSVTKQGSGLNTSYTVVPLE